MRQDQARIRPAELRAAIGLAGIFATRMLGLFMILPVLSLYVDELQGSTPFLIGIAIGIYGLTQAIFQIPLGMLSDRLGRKPVITAGLLVFALGSVVAATSDSIYGIVAGRALQGTGAIAAAVMAMAADLSREDQRLKIMAIIGMSIGAAFAVALVVGPLINGWFGLQGIFWTTALLALGALAILHLQVPTPVRSGFHRDTETVPAQLGRVLADRQLLRLDFGIMVLHMVLTATFIAVPLLLRDQVGLVADQHWHIYLPVLLLSMLGIVPFIILAERRRRMKQTLVGAVGVLLLAELALTLAPVSYWSIWFLLLAFFAAFNLLEALLPSLIAKLSSAASKGTAMGVYSSSQFIGAFLGGALGGALYGVFGARGVFGLAALMVAVWLALAVSMGQPRYLSSMVLKLSREQLRDPLGLSEQLGAVTGVVETVVIPEESVAYLKVDIASLDRKTLDGFMDTVGDT